jgi:subtilisin family serine protease
LKAEGKNPASAVPRPGAIWRVTAALLLLFCSAPAALTADDPAGTADERIRLELVLEPDELPAADRERFHDRLDAIREAIASEIPLFRSFDPREVLAESLQQLAGLGVELGERSDAILNFASLEVSAPAAARDAIAELPWIRLARPPVVATPSGDIDSDGLEIIGSELANQLGVTGAGVTVAIIDDGFNHLQATMDACFDDDGNPATPCLDELPTIPLAQQLRVNLGGTSALPIDLSDKATDPLDGEHGTACAEVVHEVAPGSSFLLISFTPQIGGQNVGGFTSNQLIFAIRRAYQLGAKVILVPMFIMTTMSDPRGVGQGGTNTFTDVVDEATAAGATVVVSAGNEDLRIVEETFTPCTNCTPQASGGICNVAPNDTAYHRWNPNAVVDSIPLNGLLFSDEVTFGDSQKIGLMTCYAATDGNPSDFELRMYDFTDNILDFPVCPGDAGMGTPIGATPIPLNQGFSVKDRDVTSGLEEDEHYYFLAVRRKNGVATPKIRVACTDSVAELEYYTGGKSLSDLGVLTNAVSVGAIDDYDFLNPLCDVCFSGHCSSRGPTGLPGGPAKPDLVAPGYVPNFTVEDTAFRDDPYFVGSSAAAAHVAGLAALLQAQAFQRTGAYLSPANVRSALTRSAFPIDPQPGEEFQLGAGMAHIPDPEPGPFVFTPMTPCRVIDTRSGAALQGGVERVVPVAGICGIPDTARSVSGILTVVSPSQLSFLSLYPSDSLPTSTSAINFPGGRTIANNIMLKLSDNTGSVRALLNAGTAHFIFDATGYFE